jgi:hypothetical protein
MCQFKNETRQPQELTEKGSSPQLAQTSIFRWLICKDAIYRKFGLKPRPFRTALSYNGKSDNQAKN